MSKRDRKAAFESHSHPPDHAPYALYGTPLPPYDPQARDDGSYVPVWQQEVTDERGRKRLHGAFTGGWSAGYFNTVGSKEGWTPATFTSSRSSKREKDGEKGREQRVEDFMDEEDLAAREEERGIETVGAFAGLGRDGAEGKRGRPGMFDDLFRATGETMGVKLLQRMGWKQGQGIGPKIRRRVQGDKKGEMHLFAPTNSRMVSFTRKTDRKGLGFAGEEKPGASTATADRGEDDESSDRDARILQTHRSKLLAKPQRKIKKSSFGVGVLNDTGSDEEDAYDIGPKISYNRVIGGDKKKKKVGLGFSNSNADTTTTGVQKPSSTSKKLTQRAATLMGFRKCHDGRLPLDGFNLSLAPLSLLSSAENTKHAPPSIPENWTSTQIQTKTDASTAPQPSTAQTAPLDPKSRAALLGETQLPGKSVFDFLSPAARERVAAATNNPNLPPARSEGAPPPTAATTGEHSRGKTLWDLVPALDARTAEAALQRAWMPYAEDAGKRERYRRFLELRAGLGQMRLPERAKSHSIDEWAKELQEFAQAAEVFKPVRGAMAARFTSSSSAAADAAVDKGGVQEAAAREKEEDPAEKAARLGMFGAMTRSRQQFWPTRLLCKRFNVRPPQHVAVDGEGAGEREVKGREVVGKVQLETMMRDATFNQVGMGGGGGFVSGGMEGGQEESQVGVKGGGREERGRIDAERNEALEGERAGEEVFRAVFGGDDET